MEGRPSDRWIRVGDNVQITEGTFQNFEGSVVSIGDEIGKIVVLIAIFGRSTPVEVENRHVRKI